jgi:O-antigen ligase
VSVVGWSRVGSAPPAATDGRELAECSLVTEADDDAESAVPLHSGSGPLQRAWTHPVASLRRPVSLSNIDQIALIVVVLLGATVFPWVVFPSSSVRAAAMICALPVGLLCLVRLLARRDSPARWAACFLVAACVSAVFAHAPWFAVLGALAPHNSALLYLGGMGCWAIGRSVTAIGRSCVTAMLYAVAVLNTMIGFVQVVVGVESGVFAVAGGRATGVLGSPIAFGVLLAGATATGLVHHVDRRGGAWPMVGVLVFSFGCALSGSRVATAILVIASVVAFGFDRGRRGLAAAACVLAGVALATWLGYLTSSATTVQRTLGRGGDGRLDVWRYGLRATLDRPLIGWGPGHHAYAIRRDFSFAFTRDHAWGDSLSAWADGHNIVLMLLVTTGAAGLFTASAWILTSLWRATDLALAAWFLAIAVGWMVEPATVGTLPLALLVLGLAGSGPRAELTEAAAQRHHAVAFALGALLAITYFLPLVIVHRALNAHNGATAATAAAWSWRDPLVADLVAERYAVDAQIAAVEMVDGGGRERANSLEWSARVPEWAPMSSWAWNSLAFRQIALGDPGAPESLRRVFELDRWNALGWQLQLRWAEESGDEQLEMSSREVVCGLELPACDDDQSGP